MKTALQKAIRSIALGLSLVVGLAGPALAQTNTDNRGGTSTNSTGTTGTTGTLTDRGSNWGWLGLVGLIGLAGLIRGNTNNRGYDTRRDTGMSGGATGTTR